MPHPSPAQLGRENLDRMEADHTDSHEKNREDDLRRQNCQIQIAKPPLAFKANISEH